MTLPDEEAGHIAAVEVPAGISAILLAVAGVLGATIVYLWEYVSAVSLRRDSNLLYHLTWNKWWFDELYDFIFVRPVLAISWFVAFTLDRGLIDGIIHLLAWTCRGCAVFVSVVGDRWIIDNGVDTFAEKTWDLGLMLRSAQTGRIRTYVTLLAVSTVVLFIVAGVWWKFAVGG